MIHVRVPNAVIELAASTQPVISQRRRGLAYSVRAGSRLPGIAAASGMGRSRAPAGVVESDMPGMPRHRGLNLSAISGMLRVFAKPKVQHPTRSVP